MPPTADELLWDTKRLLDSDLSEWAKKKLLTSIAVAWTQRDGKYEGCRFWSALALAWWHSQPKSERRRGLVHEHVVPKNLLVRFLMKNFPPWPEQIDATELLRTYFHDFLNACVVTKEEDERLNALGLRDSMPPAFDDESKPAQHGYPFVRYDGADILVVEMSSDMERVLRLIRTDGADLPDFPA